MCAHTQTLYVRGAAGAERPWEAEQDSVQTAVRIYPRQAVSRAAESFSV